jgi:hypothetical protein
MLTYCDVIIRHEGLMVLKKIRDVEFHGESEYLIRFRIAFFVFLGINVEQDAVFTMFCHFWPKLTPLLQSNLNNTWPAMLSNISEN